MAEKLPEKINKQIEKAGLPGGGALPFIPQLDKNRRGQPIIRKAAVQHGPKKGTVGYVDTVGRIWVRDRAHGSYPDHWDVQEKWGQGGVHESRLARKHPAPVRSKMRKSMAAPKHTRPHPEGNETLALFANGSSGKWAVDVDQTTSGTDRWFLQIDGPGVHFYFQIAAPEIVMQLLKFLDGELPLAKTRNRLSEESPVLIIGKERQKPVAVLRDDEYSDRYFFAIGPENSPLVRVTIAGSDLADLRNALRQTKEEMDETD